MERTLIIVKPDGVQRGLVGEIIHRLERRGLKLVGLKLMRIDTALAEQHYGVHRDMKFFPGLVSFITSSPVVVGVLEGPEAVEVTRETMGKTNPVLAKPGTIRGDLALHIGRNLIHGSDSPENAAKEIEFFFRPEELVSYERSLDGWYVE